MIEEIKEPEELTVKGIEPVHPRTTKFYVAEMKTLKNGDVEAYVSTESVDRMGDIVRAKGWVLDSFKRTGCPVLFGHDYNQPPIGKAIEIEIQRKGLWALTRFHEKTQMSRDLAMLARDGDMKSWSVGFNPLEAPEQRNEDGVFKGYIFNKQELLEYSLVPVPANAEAVSKAVFYAKKGVISNELAAILAGPSAAPDGDSGQDRRIHIPDVADNRDDLDAQLAGLHFIKRFLDV